MTSESDLFTCDTSNDNYSPGPVIREVQLSLDLIREEHVAKQSEPGPYADFSTGGANLKKIPFLGQN